MAVFLPNWVGDVVMATPALRALRTHFGQARITFVGRKIALDTLAGSGLSDAEIQDPGKQRPRVRNFLRLARELSRRRFDTAVLLPNSFRSAALAWLAGVRRIVGYDRDFRGWILTDKARPRRDPRGRYVPLSAIDYYNELVGLLGVSVDSRRMNLAASDQDARAADDLLAQAGLDPARPLVMLNPGASFGVSKMWRPERYGQLADLLIQRDNAQIIVNAAPPEKAIAADVLAAMKHPALLDFATRDNTLGLLRGLLRRCDLLVTNDTGARHFAAALGGGLVTLFGSTDPRWAEINYDLERIVRIPVECSPCQRKMCPQPPGPRYHQCLEKLTVEMALEAAEDVLARARARPKMRDSSLFRATHPSENSVNERRNRALSLIFVAGEGPLPELLRRAGLDGVEAAFAYAGGQDMTAVHLKARQRWSLDLDDGQGGTHRVYMKRYGREPLRQHLARLLTYGWRKSPAGVELAMIRACQAAGVGTIPQAAAGEEFDLWGARRSYIIMAAVPGEALEQAAEPFLARNAANPARIDEFTRLLAGLVRRFHAAGLVHRDLYTSHIFLHDGEGRIELRLIDLARAFRPRFRKFRWIVKDLAQLKYSMPASWVASHWDAFLGDYLGPELGGRRADFERAIDAKVAYIRRRGTHQARHGQPYGLPPREGAR